MRIAVAVTEKGEVSGHAGKSRHWLLFDLTAAGAALPAPIRIELAKAQVFHNFDDSGPHPLDGVGLVVAGSAGDGFIRHMGKRGANVLLTGESDPLRALERIANGESLPEQKFDITTTLCKLRDLFSHA